MDDRGAGFGEVVDTFTSIFGNHIKGGEENSQYKQSRRIKKLYPKRSRLHDGYGKND